MPIAPFTPQTTREVLEKASREVGLDPRDAQLVRMGENAMYRFASAPTVMARIGRSTEAGCKETDIARWLTAHGLPATRLADVEQPVIVDDTVVTFWEYIDESDEQTTSADLGTMLRNLHELPGPADFSLPPFDPMPKVSKRLANIGTRLPDREREFLNEKHTELAAEFSRLDFELDSGPLHGDYHAANLMRDHSGRVRLIDFEDFCWGPREWDASVQAVRYRALGWVSDVEYSNYVDAYGFDPLDWPGFPVIRAIRELNMTTWLAQQLGQSSEVDAEVRKRIADLRDGQAPRHWRAF